MIMNKCSISSLSKRDSVYQIKNDGIVKEKIINVIEPKIVKKSCDFIPIEVPRFSALKVFGKRWYYLLNPNPTKKSRALLQDHSKSSLKGHLVVSWEPVSLPDREVGNTKLLYAYFDSYIDFHIYMRNFSELERTFYETIIGDFYQKPHFDIDIQTQNEDFDFESVSKEVIEKLIWSIIETFKNKFNIDIDIEKDILLYSSHGEKKKSNHLVINNYCHANNKEARYFYDECLKLIFDPEITKYIDHAVYGKSQQYRIVGCQKKGSGRTKKLCDKFNYNGKEYTHQFLEKGIMCTLYESLVTFTSGCRLLPSIQPEVTKSFFTNETIFNDDDVKIIIEKIEDNFGLGVFSFDNIQGEFMNLKRLKPSYCECCKRIHSSQNPYITVWENNVYFNCRRSVDGKGYKLMNLKKEKSLKIDSDLESYENSALERGFFNITPKNFVKPVEIPSGGFKINKIEKNDEIVKKSRKFNTVEHNSKIAERKFGELLRSKK